MSLLCFPSSFISCPIGAQVAFSPTRLLERPLGRFPQPQRKFLCFPPLIARRRFESGVEVSSAQRNILFSVSSKSAKTPSPPCFLLIASLRKGEQYFSFFPSFFKDLFFVPRALAADSFPLSIHTGPEPPPVRASLTFAPSPRSFRKSGVN